MPKGPAIQPAKAPVRGATHPKKRKLEMPEPIVPLDPYGPSAGRKHMTGKPPRPKTVTVDLHSHLRVVEADDFVKPHLPPEGANTALRYTNPKSREYYAQNAKARAAAWTDIPTRLADMDKMDLDVMAVSSLPTQFYYVTEKSVGQELAHIINDGIKAKIKDHPKRFVGVGTLPMQDTDMAIKELNRLHNDLGFRAIQIGARCNDDELSAERFEPLWKRCEELGTVIFVHPSSFASTRFSRHHLTNLIGNPLDTTTAMHYLIFDGVMMRYPKIKFYMSHGGAFASAYSARMDHAFGSRPDTREFISEMPSTYLKQFYLDTIVFSTHQLKYLVEQFGADKIALGTDYPADMGEYTPVEHVYQTDLTETEREKICGLNALKMLGLDAAQFKR
jgi:aminocarboxymuconate-semialdehyde decarboxylase